MRGTWASQYNIPQELFQPPSKYQRLLIYVFQCGSWIEYHSVKPQTVKEVSEGSHYNLNDEKISLKQVTILNSIIWKPVPCSPQC